MKNVIVLISVYPTSIFKTNESRIEYKLSEDEELLQMRAACDIATTPWQFFRLGTYNTVIDFTLG